MTESAQEKLRSSAMCLVLMSPSQSMLINFIYAYFYAPHHKRKSRDNFGTVWFWFWVSRVQRSISRNTNGLFALRFAIRCWSRAVLGGEEAEEFCAI